jgi:hypothetical protein
MTHYVNPDGRFIKAFNEPSSETLEALKLKYLPAVALSDATRPVRTKTGEAGEDPESDGEDEGEGGVHVEPYNSKTKNLSGNKARMDRDKISPKNNRAGELH